MRRQQSVILQARLIERLSENGVVEEHVSSHDSFESIPTDDEVQLLVDAIKWLEAEGVIRTNGGFSGSRDNESIYGATLTSRGSWLLDQELSEDLTLGGAIRKVNSGKPSMTGVDDFIGGILGGFTKSVSR